MRTFTTNAQKLFSVGWRDDGSVGRQVLTDISNQNLDHRGIRKITGLIPTHLNHSPRNIGFVEPIQISPACAGKGLEDLVFSSDGKYLPRPKSTGGWFAGAVKRAKIQKVTPHDLRHTAASLAVSAGVNVLALQRMLGHKSAKVTLDTYADLFDTDLDAVANTLHASYSRGIVGKVWAMEAQDSG